MGTINKEPITVDFGNADQDGAIRLVTKGSIEDIERLDLTLVDGAKVWLTDNDVEAKGTLVLRDDMWVVVIDEEGFAEVPRDAAHHISKLN